MIGVVCLAAWNKSERSAKWIHSYVTKTGRKAAWLRDLVRVLWSLGLEVGPSPCFKTFFFVKGFLSEVCTLACQLLPCCAFTS